MRNYLTKTKDMMEDLAWKVQFRRSWLSKKKEEFLKDESGMGTIEMVLLIVVLILLVLVFRERIGGVLDAILGQIETSSQRVWSRPSVS